MPTLLVDHAAALRAKHARSDNQERLLGFILTGGEASDYIAAEPLMQIPVATPKAVLADSADSAMQSFSRLLSFAFDRGQLAQNIQPTPIIRTLDFARKWVAAVPWIDLESARRVLESCHAFVDPTEADDRGIRLRLPAQVLE